MSYSMLRVMRVRFNLVERIVHRTYCKETISHQAEVFNLLNNSNENDLSKHLAKTTSRSILQYRQRIGEIKSIEDVLAIKGFSKNKFEKLCQSINACSELKVSSRKPKFKSTPSMTFDKWEDSDSICSINISLPFMTVAKVSKTGEVLFWNEVTLTENIKKLKPIYPVIYHLVEHAMTLIPDSDLYLFEEKTFRPRQITLPNVQHIILHAMIDSMLVVFLNQRNETENSVYTVKEHVSTVYFELNVGHERVTGVDFLLALLNGKGPDHIIDVSQNFIDTFISLKPVEKERWSNTLLLAIAFNERLKERFEEKLI